MRHGDPFYKSKEWAGLRAKILKRDGYRCRICHADVKAKGMAVVDHIEPRRKRPDLAMDPANLWCICRPCHDSFKRQYEASTNTPVDENGYPAGWT